MMFWTHKYDLLFKLLGLAAFVGLYQVSGIALNSAGPSGTSEQFVEIARFSTFAFFLSVGWALVWRPLLRPASTWCYVRRTFDAPLSWRDAKDLSPLFSITLTEGMKWHPSTDVVDLPVEQRLSMLRSRSEALRQAQSVGFLARTRQTSALGRLLSPATYNAWFIVSMLGLVPIFLGALFQAGPASFLAGWTSSSDGTYRPQLSCLLGCLAWVVITWAAAFACDRFIGSSSRSPGVSK
jgi:hypothetical protein